MDTKSAGIMAAFLLTAPAVMGGVFTIAGYTFDEDNSVKTAKAVEGASAVLDHSSKVFARAGQVDAKGQVAAVNEFLAFDRSKTIGRLMGFAGRRSADDARYVSFPERGKGTVQPNQYRSTLELTWGDATLPNKAGYDFVIYEVGTYEGFSVSVRKAGSTEFSAPRYRFSDQYDMTHDVNAVAFDISSFGIEEGEQIDAIRIRNVFNSESPHGADKVDDPGGEGKVLSPGDPGYESGFKLLAKVRGDEFRTEFLDADITYVVGLHTVVRQTRK